MTGELIESAEEDESSEEETHESNPSINSAASPKPKMMMMGLLKGGMLKNLETVVETVLNQQEESL